MHSSACRDDTKDTMSRFSLAVRAGAHPLHLAPPCDTCRAREFSACAPLTAEEQKRLAAIMRTVNIAPHSSIFDEADPAEYVYTITAGTVKVYKLLGDGRRQITGFLFAGDFLGLTHNEAYAYSAEALVPTRLCRFPAGGSRLFSEKYLISSNGSWRWRRMSWPRRRTRWCSSGASRRANASSPLS